MLQNNIKLNDAVRNAFGVQLVISVGLTVFSLYVCIIDHRQRIKALASLRSAT